MITIIFGAPGAGKTALMTYFLRETFKRDGKRLLASSQEKIRETDIEHGSSLEMPKKPPIYSDFPVRIPYGYESYFQPYFINGYFFGVPNGSMPTINVAPNAKIFLSEGQRYFDSRQSKAFPSWVSAAFDMHRHYGLEIYIDVQRPKLIDLNIRELCRHFIEVRDIELERTETGRILTTTFRCREFKSRDTSPRARESSKKLPTPTEATSFASTTASRTVRTSFPKATKTTSISTSSRKAKRPLSPSDSSTATGNPRNTAKKAAKRKTHDSRA